MEKEKEWTSRPTEEVRRNVAADVDQRWAVDLGQSTADEGVQLPVEGLDVGVESVHQLLHVLTTVGVDGHLLAPPLAHVRVICHFLFHFLGSHFQPYLT